MKPKTETRYVVERRKGRSGNSIVWADAGWAEYERLRDLKDLTDLLSPEQRAELRIVRVTTTGEVVR
jgi:hypothetical protein